MKHIPIHVAVPVLLLRLVSRLFFSLRLGEAWPPLALTLFDFLPLEPVKPVRLLIRQSVLSLLLLHPFA